MAQKYSDVGTGFIRALYQHANKINDPKFQIDYVQGLLAANTMCEPYEDPEFPGKALYREVGLDLEKMKKEFFFEQAFDDFVARTKLRVINYPGRCGWTLLGACAENGAIDLAKWVIQHGGNPDYCNDRGQSMKEIAAAAGLPEGIRKQFMDL